MADDIRRSDGYLAVRMAGFNEVDVREPGERVAVVIGREGPVACLSESRADRRWPVQLEQDGRPGGHGFGFLVGAVRGMQAGLWAVAWVRIEEGGGAEILVEDLDPPFYAERVWTADRASGEWKSEPAIGLAGPRHEHG